MNKSYKMIKEYGEASFVERKSKFISYAAPIYSEEEAIQFLNSIRKKHYDATHNCYAYIIGENFSIQRSSDDGEPSGTAGVPILEVLKKEELTNTIIVVTRYFGGIMLGAGGLIRAYTEGAVRSITVSGIIEVKPFAFFTIKADYSCLGKIQYEATKKSYLIKNIDYAEAVTITMLAPIEQKEALENDINSWTGGGALINYLGNEMLKVDQKSGNPI